ncbi:FAR1-related sequence 5 [Hibiscus syriacus]|uniref:FAR1-related sequence 5 n=1 Tax=Hibiscus syriacus TaxID=106335 RepID=A0A6A2WP39_HIBSY|nr:BAG family molecular chaperone regulator 8, chloroplastic-like [Hibiscus syriacus]KAE8655760.1 FAR1-related sequence 5 [Hibiscus syriacus]
MASYHHHTATSCYACFCSQPRPPPPQQSDPLLQAFASLLLQVQPQQNHYPSQTHGLKSFQDQNFATKNQHFDRRHHHQEELDIVLFSLVNRINALESSLQHFSRASNSSSHPSLSLKDAAARVIQTHFRAFLVHRSRTLRKLKDLAFVKSSLDSLTPSVYNKTHFDNAAVSRKAMDLLHKLDSLKGGDPMIRDGRRSVRRDLRQFLEYIHGLGLERNKHLFKNANNVRVCGNGNKARIFSSNSRGAMEKMRDRVENLERLSINEEGDYEDGDVELEGFHQALGESQSPRLSVAENRNGGVLVKRQGIQPRVKKTVSFAENGNIYRIIQSGDGNLADESVSSDDHGGIMENLVIEENGKEMKLNNKEASYDYEIQDGDFVFSAPLPVKMESKADLMKRRKGTLQIVS